MSYIELKDVTKQYGEGETAVYANDHISFSVEQGQFVVILGPSGAGKSTLLNILGGMDRPTSGSVIVDGKDIASLSDRELTTFRRESVGFVFQFYNLIPNLSAEENIEMSEQIAGEKDRRDDIFDVVGLADKRNAFPAELSGGEQQRVSIARAIAKQPKLLLCDEPTGALDSTSGKQIIKLLLEQSHSYHRTVLVITHDQRIAELADVVLEIHDGKIANHKKQEHAKKVEEIAW
ncbi:MAG: ABC transporter ATP-binding protein [Aerococcus sp.]|nr:ABC transporter ATP-binding protein [Aerococcus sp.]